MLLSTFLRKHVCIIIICICIIIYRWLQIRLQCIGAFIVLFVSLLAVIGRDTLSAGVVGLIITNALHVSLIKYKTKYQKEGRIYQNGILKQCKSP